MLYNVCNYLSMLGLKLIHVSKRGHRQWVPWVWRRKILHHSCQSVIYMDHKALCKRCYLNGGLSVRLWDTMIDHVASLILDDRVMQYVSLGIILLLLAPWKYNIRTHVTNSIYEHFLQNCSQMNTTEHFSWLMISQHWFNELVPSSNMPLPEPMLTEIHVIIRCH